MISPIYNEIIRALGAQDTVVGIDLSTTYPSDVKKVQTIGYHRALSAESILSLSSNRDKRVGKRSRSSPSPRSPEPGSHYAMRNSSTR